MPCLFPLFSTALLRFRSGAMRCVNTGVAALSHVGQPREEVVPALGVRCERALRKAAVHQAQARALAGGLEVDLDGAGARWHNRVVPPAPGEDHAARRDHLDEASVDDVLVVLEVDVKGPAGSRLELRE